MSGASMATEYPVHAASGELIARHVRHQQPDGSKVFSWRSADGSKGLGGLPVRDLPLYGIHLLGADALVIVTEGERATDALRTLGAQAVGTVTGAAAVPGMAALGELTGRDVVLWPDADDVGRRHMDRIASALLASVTPRVRALSWTEAPEHGDAADFVAAGGTMEQLHELIDSATGVARGTAPRDPERVVEPVQRVNSADRPAGHAGDGSWPLDRAVMRDVRWLWPDHIAYGKLTILDGDPGMGKSTLAGADLTARVSTGAAMPDGSGGSGRPQTALILSAEDDPHDTIAPRIVAAGGVLSRVFIARLREPGTDDPFAGILPDAGDDPDRGTRSLVLPDDLPRLAQMITRRRAALVIIDPLVAYLASSVDSHRDQDVRRPLAELAEIAARSGAAIVATRHLNKSGGGSALYRGGGSIGFIAAVRTGLVVGTDPGDETRSILSVSKSNIGRIPQSIAYRIAPAIVDTEHGTVSSSRIEWLGPVDMTASDLLSRSSGDPDERSALDDARHVLRTILDGGSVPATKAAREAYDAGLTRATLLRAKKAEGVISEKIGRPGGAGHWEWRLPPKGLTEARRDSLPEAEHLRILRDDVSPFAAGESAAATGSGPAAGDPHGYRTLDDYVAEQRAAAAARHQPADPEAADPAPSGRVPF